MYFFPPVALERLGTARSVRNQETNMTANVQDQTIITLPATRPLAAGANIYEPNLLTRLIAQDPLADH